MKIAWSRNSTACCHKHNVLNVVTPDVDLMLKLSLMVRRSTSARQAARKLLNNWQQNWVGHPSL